MAAQSYTHIYRYPLLKTDDYDDCIWCEPHELRCQNNMNETDLKRRRMFDEAPLVKHFRLAQKVSYMRSRRNNFSRYLYHGWAIVSSVTTSWQHGWILDWQDQDQVVHITVTGYGQNERLVLYTCILELNDILAPSRCPSSPFVTQPARTVAMTSTESVLKSNQSKA